MRFFTLLGFIFILSRSISYGQELSPEQKVIVNKQVIALLNNYSQYATFSENGNELSDGYISGFKNLFRNAETKIYNDIEPDKVSGENMSIDNYIAKVRECYRAGLTVTLTTEKAIINQPLQYKYEKSNFIVSASANKMLMGFYKNQKIHKSENTLHFIITFKLNGSNLTDFKILTIQKTEPDILTIANDKSLKKTATYVGVHFTAGLSGIGSKNIKNNSNWTYTNKIGYSGGVDVNYFFTHAIGIGTGLGVSYYSSTLKLNDYNNNNSRTKTIETDKDGDTFYRFVEASIEESNQIIYLDIPINMQLKVGKPGKIGIFVKAGAVVSYLLSAKCSVSGNSTHQGYYPQHHVILNDLDEYGYTYKTFSGEKYDWELNTLNISGNMSAGVRIPVSKSLLLSFGPDIYFGLTDLKYAKAKHRDDYLSLFGEPGTTKTKFFGFNIGLNLKL